MVGQNTVGHLGGRITVSELGRVRVKGKSLAVTVGTPVTLGDLAALPENDRLTADVHAERLSPDDPRLAVLSRDLPQVAGFYRKLVTKLGESP